MTGFFVQFPHPGAEHNPRTDEMSWNTAPHRRKFLITTAILSWLHRFISPSDLTPLWSALGVLLTRGAPRFRGFPQGSPNGTSPNECAPASIKAAWRSRIAPSSRPASRGRQCPTSCPDVVSSSGGSVEAIRQAQWNPLASRHETATEESCCFL